MGYNSVPKFIFRLSRFPVYRGSVLGRFYCTAQSVLTLNSSLYCPLLHVSALSMSSEIYLTYKGQNIG